MGLENPTYVSQFVSTNPTAGDPISQGDDHLRRMKAALQNTFPNANRAFYFERSAAPVAAVTITLAASDDRSTIKVDTSLGRTVLQLPAGVDGWEVTVLKVTTDLNPIIVTPPVGTLFSGPLNLGTCRRNVPRTPFKIRYVGTNYVVDRCVQVPVGTILDFDGATLPVGFEWPNGQVLASAAADYPDYNSAKGSGATRDFRGRTSAGRDDMGGAAAGRLTAVSMTPDALTLGATGGTEQGTLSIGQLPTFTVTGTISGNGATTFTPTISGSGNVTYTDPHHTHTPGNIAQFVSSAGGGGGIAVYVPGAGVAPTISSDATGLTIPATNVAAQLTNSSIAATAIAGSLSWAGNAVGSGNPVTLLQPTLVMNKILVVE